MPTINLAPETRYLLEQKKRQQFLFLVAFGIVILSLLIWAGLAFTRSVVQQQLQQVQAEINAVETRISELDDVAQRIVLFERRSAALQQLLTSRLNWDPILQEIERLLPPPAVLHRLTAADDGSLELEGNTPDIDILAQTLASLKTTPTHATLFPTINFKGINRQETGGYNFTAHLTFKRATN